MWKRSKFLILFLMGILVGVGFYMGLHAARLYRPLPPPPAPQASAQPSAKPKLSPRQEELLNLIAQAQSALTSPPQAQEKALQALKASYARISSLTPTELQNLAHFRYPLRALAALCQASPPGRFSFPPYQEAVYAVYWDPQRAKANLATSLAIFLALNRQDQEAMMELHNRLNLGPTPQGPLQAFRNLYTSHPRQSASWERLHSLLPQDLPWSQMAWAEVGYAEGELFSPLRQALGPKATLWGVGLDSTQARLVERLAAFAPLHWQPLRLVEGSSNDCHLPPQTFQVVHLSTAYRPWGESRRELEEWEELFQSLRRAILPGGYLLLEGVGPTQERGMRELLLRQDWQWLQTWPAREHKDEHELFVLVFRAPQS